MRVDPMVATAISLLAVKGKKRSNAGAELPNSSLTHPRISSHERALHRSVEHILGTPVVAPAHALEISSQGQILQLTVEVVFWCPCHKPSSRCLESPRSQVRSSFCNEPHSRVSMLLRFHMLTSAILNVKCPRSLVKIVSLSFLFHKLRCSV